MDVVRLMVYGGDGVGSKPKDFVGALVGLGLATLTNIIWRRTTEQISLG